jgi:hypothetical protein
LTTFLGNTIQLAPSKVKYAITGEVLDLTVSIQHHRRILSSKMAKKEFFVKKHIFWQGKQNFEMISPAHIII